METFIWLLLAAVAIVFMYARYKRQNPLHIPKDASVWDPAVQKQAAAEAQKQTAPYMWTFPIFAVGFVLWAILEFAQQTLSSLMLAVGFLCFASLALQLMYTNHRDAAWRRSKLNVYTLLGLLFVGMLLSYGSIIVTKTSVPLQTSDWIWVIIVLGAAIGSWYYAARK